MKLEIISDAACFRRGFYSCHEEHPGEVKNDSEMGRISDEKVKEEVQQKILFQKLSRKRRMIPRSLRSFTKAMVRCRKRKHKI